MSEREFAGKAVLVTGGSRGMGRACVERFLRGGAAVTAFADDRASLDEVRRAAGPGARLRCVEGDVGRRADCEAAVARTVEAFGGLDALACCAGIQRYGTVVDTDEAVWDAVLGVNLKGVYLAAQAAIPAMRARGGGAVVAISSVQALASQTNVAATRRRRAG